MPNMFTDPWTLDGSLNAYGSLGIHIAADGMVDDAWPGMPAFDGGVANGMKIIAVNGRRFSSDELARALRASKTADGPMELIVENGSYFKTVKLDYHGGLRYPHLERAPGASDLLTAIATARQ
jgi:predicted metalloprotease with PDZ domain